MTAPAQDEVVARLAPWLTHHASCKSENNAMYVGAYPCDCGLDAALAHRADVARVELQPIDSAPRTGRHILVYDLTPNSDGFGIFDGVRQPFAAVAHYWSHLGEEGFYLSSGSIDEPLMRITHWKEI